MANIVGTIGADELQGTATADSISGLAGDDRIDGLGGNDRILGGDGLDRIEGGDGNDYILGGRDADRVNGGAGDDVLQGGAGNDGLSGDAGNDLLYGGDGGDGLNGGDGNDRLWGGGGDDALAVGGFNLVEDRMGGDDLLYGGPGRDYFSVLRDEEVGLIGTQQTTVMDFNAAEDTLRIAVAVLTPEGPGGYDLPFDYLDSNHNGVLDAGDQFVNVQQVTADGISKLSTVIDISGFQGDDPLSETLTVHGVIGLTADTFDGERFKGQPIEGTSGPDRLVGTGLDETLIGGDGHDLLYGLAGNDSMGGGAGNDLMYGGSGNEYMIGNDGADRLFGGAGDDVLFGDNDFGITTPLVGSADDYLFGDAGDDALFGSFGHDVLTGGAGRDNFGVIGVGAVLDDGSKPTVDVLLTDFVRGEDVLNGQTISFDKYDVNGDGQIKGSDPYVTLKQVTYGGETAISLVINLHADDATVATGKLTLFGVTGLDQSDFTSASYV